jgi:hypothetical protein
VYQLERSVPSVQVVKNEIKTEKRRTSVNVPQAKHVNASEKKENLKYPTS